MPRGQAVAQGSYVPKFHTWPSRSRQASVILIFDVEHDLGARRLGLPINRVGVGHHEVGTLRLPPADFVRLRHQAVERRIADGAEHDHAVAEAELGVGDRALVARHDHLLFKSKRPAQPLDGRCGVAIAQTGNNGRFCVLGNRAHGGSRYKFLRVC
jgi:hypothetical protein